MAIIIPEYILANVIKKIIKYVQIDWENKNSSKEEYTLLYQFFNEDSFQGAKVNYGKHDLYEEAKSLFLRKEEDGSSRVLDVRTFFDKSRASVPTIHITLPAEAPEHNSLGVDESGLEEDIIWDDQSKESYPVYTRNFKAQYTLVITSDNSNEVLLIYSFLKALFVSTHDVLPLLGLDNLQIKGQELNINSEISPPHIFYRGLSLTFDYDIEVPRMFSNKIRTELFFNGKTIETESSTN